MTPGTIAAARAIELRVGNFQPGRFAWCLSNVRALPEPVPLRGRQGIFDVPDDLIPDLCPPTSGGGPQ